MLLEMLSIGMASLADRNVFAPRKREHLPQINFQEPLLSSRRATLDTSLRVLRDQAWSSIYLLEQEAIALKSSRG